MKADYDVAVVGSGFAGALLSMIARSAGRSVVLLERGAHPRFAIGESSTPLANLLLEELAARYGLEGVRPLAKWGTWQAACPQIACGLKRGFTFYHHQFHQPWDDSRGRQLLVAASPHDAVADTHWYREEFDAYLVREAQAHGVEYLDHVQLHAVQPGTPVVLEGVQGARRVHLRAQLLVDASGPRGCLHRLLPVPSAKLPWMPSTQTLYSHFQGVQPWPEEGSEPYPPNAAAMHHVFPGGWIWVLRFNNGITSAGVVATPAIKLNERGPAWQRLLERLPAVGAQFREARPVFPSVYQAEVPFRASAVSGPGWVMLPSAAGFIDPMLSTGFPLTLLGVERLGALITERWGTPEFGSGLKDYARLTKLELLATERLIAALYTAFDDFELFSAITLLYFAAASYTETVRRLGRAELAGAAFLCCQHPEFGPRMRACLREVLDRRSGSTRRQLLDQLRAAIQPIDVAGLSNSARWYPVCAEDVFKAAHKVKSSRVEIERMLEQAGFGVA